MRLLTPLVINHNAPLARANPLAKLAAGLVIMVALFVSVDVVTAVIVLIGLAAAAGVSGLSPRTLLGRAWPILLLAFAVGVLNVILAADQVGPVAVRFGTLRLGADTLLAGVGLGIRLVGIALAGLLAVASTEPTDLADALVQQARVSPRFAVGALAAVRLLPVLAEEWQTIRLARRARGVEAGRSPLAAVRLAANQLMGLLVVAVRRGTRLALAMEARGFGAMPCRSVARPQRMRAADWGWVAASVMLGAAAIGISMLVGTWQPLWS